MVDAVSVLMDGEVSIADMVCFYEHNFTHFTYSMQLYAILSVLMEEHAAMLGSVAVPLDGEGRAAQNVSQTCVAVTGRTLFRLIRLVKNQSLECFIETLA